MFKKEQMFILEPTEVNFSLAVVSQRKMLEQFIYFYFVCHSLTKISSIRTCWELRNQRIISANIFALMGEGTKAAYYRI